MKILFLDTETSPTLGYFYGRYDLRISTDQVIDNGFFLSFQYAWNDKKVVVENLSHVKHKLTSKDDKELCRKMSKLISEADVIVAHNAIKFDLAVLAARLCCHGLPPFEPKAVVDTLRACRRYFRFESNSLDSVCQQLGIGRKGHSGGFETSIACMNGDKEAWKRHAAYGAQDVELLRALYYKILPNIQNHPNHNLFDLRAKSVCPKCGSEDIQWRGGYYGLTMSYNKFVCKSCGGWGHERINNIDKEKRDTIVKGC